MHVANWISGLQFVFSAHLIKAALPSTKSIWATDFFKTLANIPMHHNGSTFVPEFTNITVTRGWPESALMIFIKKQVFKPILKNSYAFQGGVLLQHPLLNTDSSILYMLARTHTHTCSPFLVSEMRYTSNTCSSLAILQVNNRCAYFLPSGHDWRVGKLIRLKPVPPTAAVTRCRCFKFKRSPSVVLGKFISR